MAAAAAAPAEWSLVNVVDDGNAWLKIKENMSFVSNLAHSLVIEWKMSTILTKNFCRI